MSPHTVDLRRQWIYLRTHLARMLVSHITVTDTRSCRYCMTMLEYLMALKRVENDINFSAFCSCFLVKSIVEPLAFSALLLLCWPKKFNFLLASMRVSLQVELLDWQHYFWEHQESVPRYQKSRVRKTSNAYDHLRRPVYDEMNLLKPWCTRTASEFIHYVLAKFTQMFGHCSTPVATSQNPVE